MKNSKNSKELFVTNSENSCWYQMLSEKEAKGNFCYECGEKEMVSHLTTCGIFFKEEKGGTTYYSIQEALVHIGMCGELKINGTSCQLC